MESGLKMNKILRATTKNKEVRAFVADTKDLVNEAVEIHGTSPVSSAALGRLLTAGAMMGVTLKGSKDLITLTIKGDGHIKTLIVTANGSGHVKGYISNPIVDIPVNDHGKLDVSKAIGKGSLTVIRDLGLKEPYVGQVELISGEIADDLTYYFASSEQVPSVVALGVLTTQKDIIKQAGGFIIQLMPGASEETIKQIEKNIHSIPSVTSMFEQGLDSEGILSKVLEGFEVTLHDVLEPEYRCNCSRERMEKALISIGKDDMKDMIHDGETIEMNCHFCNKKYHFDIERLKTLYEIMK